MTGAAGAGSIARLTQAVRRRVRLRYLAAVFPPAIAVAVPFAASVDWAAAIFLLAFVPLAWAADRVGLGTALYGDDGRCAMLLGRYQAEVLTPVDLLVDEGRAEEAAAALGDLDPGSPWGRFQRARLARRLAWLADGVPAAAADEPGVPTSGLGGDAAKAAAALAVDDAARLLAAGGPWRRRLLDAGPGTAAPDRSGPRQWRALWAGAGLAAVAIVALVAATDGPPPPPFGARGAPAPSVSGDWLLSGGPDFSGRPEAPLLDVGPRLVPVLSAAIPGAQLVGPVPLATVRGLSAYPSQPVLRWSGADVPGPVPGLAPGQGSVTLFFSFGDYARTGDPIAYALVGDGASGSAVALRIDDRAARAATDTLYPGGG